MKKLILTVVLVIGMITTTFAQFGDTEKSYNKNRIQDKQEYNNTIMYQSNIPTGFIGIKYAYLGNFGGYMAFTSDFGIVDEVYQLTVGITKKVSSSFNIYLGYGREFIWAESIIDAGIIYRKDRFSLGIGGGINIDDPAYSYGSIGVGFIF